MTALHHVVSYSLLLFFNIIVVSYIHVNICKSHLSHYCMVLHCINISQLSICLLNGDLDASKRKMLLVIYNFRKLTSLISFFKNLSGRYAPRK